MIFHLKTGHRELLFDAGQSKETPPQARGLEDQDERESQKLWLKVVEALKERNHDAATDEKTRIEEMQRAEAARRAEDGVEWRPRLFRPVRGGPGGSEEGEEDLDWILNADMSVRWLGQVRHRDTDCIPVTAQARRSRTSKYKQSYRLSKDRTHLVDTIYLRGKNNSSISMSTGKA